MVAALPLVLGLLMGGSDGLEAGLLGAMASTGGFLEGREKARETDLKRLESLTESQLKTKSLQLGAEESKAKLVDDFVKNYAKAHPSSPIKDYVVENPALLAAQDPQIIKDLQRGSPAVHVIKAKLKKLEDLVNSSGGSFLNPGSKEYVEAQQLYRGMMLDVKELKNLGAAFTDIEAELSSSFAPDLTGFLAAYRGKDIALQQISTAREFLDIEMTHKTEAVGLLPRFEEFVDDKTGAEYRADNENGSLELLNPKTNQYEPIKL